MYVRMYVCIYVCMYDIVCMTLYAWMYTCIYVCMYVWYPGCVCCTALMRPNQVEIVLSAVAYSLVQHDYSAILQCHVCRCGIFVYVHAGVH